MKVFLSSLAGAPFRTLRDHAYDALLQAIFDGRLAPGDRLVEAEVSAALGSSRGPVREAMRRLEAEGLLVTRSHRDTHVVTITGTDIRELYAVRAALEGFAAVEGLTVLRTDHLALMDEELDALDQAAHERDWDRVAVLDAHWHQHMTQAAHNTRLMAAWTTSNGPLRMIFARAARVVYQPGGVRQRHAALLHVLRTQEGAVIEQAIRDHYQATAQHFAALVDSPSPALGHTAPLITSESPALADTGAVVESGGYSPRSPPVMTC